MTAEGGATLSKCRLLPNVGYCQISVAGSVVAGSVVAGSVVAGAASSHLVPEVKATQS